jgi:cytochrome o ubiquinol oxidase subunit 1
MAYIVGLMNYVMPLQIGARDVAFPFLNNLSFWFTFWGAILFMVSLFVGDFSTAGWLGYPPVSELQQGPGVDYYIWGLQLSGVGTLLTGVNFVTTIMKMRAPGMSMMKMPVFSWTALCTSGLILATFPVLTATLFLLSLDRYLGTHFFTTDFGGNLMMYINLIWVWGHPEVYILILPIFGVYSEIVPTFSGKPLFGYSSMVYATVAIMILSYLVWLHHFFTMGSGADVNSFFSLTTMIISIPTGVKIFNWLFTMYRGRVRFTVPMLWTMGFLFTFTIGGMTGVMLSVAPADFLLHNSLFLIAHFHNVIIGGVVFGVFAAVNYWFPKAFGFKLDESWGKASFWFWLVGFWVAFTPLYIMGLMGVTRRLSHFDNPALQPYFHCRRVRRLPDRAGHPRVRDPDRRQHHAAQGLCRGRRPVERPHAGVVHLLAAAGLQLRLHPERARTRRLDGHEEARLPAPAGRLPSHPHAEEHSRRRSHRRIVLRLLLRAGLVHLVAGRGIVRGHHRRVHRPHLQLPPRLPHSRGPGADVRAQRQLAA